jgi:hypothetical protein
MNSPVSDEARKLVEAFQGWLAARPADAPLANGSAECCVCPVCRVIAQARAVRPDAVEHWSNSAVEAVGILRSWIGQAFTPSASESGDVPDASTEEVDPKPPVSRPKRAAQRIDVEE